jgi:hypothetical protein
MRNITFKLPPENKIWSTYIITKDWEIIDITDSFKKLDKLSKITETEEKLTFADCFAPFKDVKTFKFKVGDIVKGYHYAYEKYVYVENPTEFIRTRH